MRRDDQAAALAPDQARAADSGVKAMIPVGRPFLDFVLSGLADAGFTDVALVVAPEHRAIRRYYDEDAPPSRVRLSYVVQPEPLGTANAVLALEAFAGDDLFLVLNSDNYYPVDSLRALRECGEPAVTLFSPARLAALGNIPIERTRAYAVADVDAAGYLTRLVEKPHDYDPTTETRARISMNSWMLPPQIFDACRAIPLSPRGEYELPLAIAYAIADGVRIRALAREEGVLDLSYRGDIASVAERLRDVAVTL